MGQYVGIDLHRRSITIYRMVEDGEILGIEQIVSQPLSSPSHGGGRGPSAR